MFGKKVIPIAIFIMCCLVFVSCQKLPERGRPARPLKVETLPSLDAIPLEYGNLVAVTTSGEQPGRVQLWFEKQDKTIVVVRVDYISGRPYPAALIIPRK